ncbi:HypC/HybG/HupF family hydrogenase formation chaperone [Nocardioides sp.]|uniref:HypC/HybG/HupF family hydrogenase formation chaperone n=1 Tax=Nocardioides sp. TaxID=35761 RepID=UPI0027330536|nr:HypC/HybG/HupF family hydrogenase formation chaperone [Nocardioides sp.]MDP3893350.1 HypC/HybG/HupF family hydrogenase formation chaperone [Nocardioides sp.]
MCLGDLAQVVDRIDDRTVRARVGDRLVTVSLLTFDGPVAPGDWLQVHSGFALARLTEAEQREAAQIRNTSQEETR